MEKFDRILLVYLPKQSNFKRKIRIKENKRYQRIKEMLESELIQPYLLFIAFVSQDFDSFPYLF